MKYIVGLFLCLLITAAALTITPTPVSPPPASLVAAMMALSLRGALGIWHFLQDRWIWKLSDPRVRATIGRDLFSRAAA